MASAFVIDYNEIKSDFIRYNFSKTLNFFPYE